jgi:MscS family membrane protein
MLYCFTRTVFWGQWLEIKEKLALKVKAIVEGAGTGFAFPSRSIYMSTPAGEKPEAFMPPGEQPR